MSGAALLALLVVVAIASLAGLATLARRSDPGREWSEEELERRGAAKGSGLLATSMRVLGEQLDSGAHGAAEEREAEREGARPEESHPGEPPVPGESVGPGPSSIEDEPPVKGVTSERSSSFPSMV